MSRLEQLKQVAALSPDDPLSHYALGLEYINLQQWADAIAAFAEALKVDAKYAPAYYHQARAEIKAGEHGVAQDTLKTGIGVADAAGDTKTVKEMQQLLDTIS